MFTISVSFWSLNLNQKLLWLLPPFLLFNVCKHQYIKKNPEGTRFWEKIKWPRIYIIMFTQYQYSPPPNTKHWHNFGRQYRLLKNALYELISYDCKSTEKNIHIFFCAFIMWSYCKPYEHIRSSDPWVERLTIKKDGVITMHSVYMHLL